MIFYCKKKYGDYSGWIGYTLGETRYHFPVYGDGYYSADQDVTHELKIVNTYKYKHWIFAASWIFATGKPYTQPLGEYSLINPDGSTSNYIVTGAKNATIYPNYHRLDISANYAFSLGKTAKGNFSFSLFNVYNKKNIWYKEFQFDETGLSETDVTFLGITPNLTLTIQLR